jgi:UDP-glucose 4-epimerase
MKVLVTGCGGFIGSNLADKFIQQGHQVIGIDNLSTGKIENINKLVKFYNADITDFEEMKDIFEKEKPEYVFHLAALPRIQFSLDYPVESFQANVVGTQNLLEVSKLTGVKRFIYSSSSSVYGDQEIPLKEDMNPKPISLYAVHKYMGELLCKKYSEFFKMETVCLRYFNVYGLRMNQEGAYKLVLAIWLEQKRNKQPLTIYGRGGQTRDFTHVNDVVRANMAAMKADKKMLGEVINVGSGEETKIIDLAQHFQWKMEFVKNPRNFEEKRKLADISKAQSILRWKPITPIADGIKEIIKDK